jgi:hypothetical protein
MNVFEGGNVFKDKMGLPLTQRINQADIPGTIQWLESVLNMDLSGPEDTDTGYPSRWLGSTGKKESSGDLDIAIDTNEASKEAVAAKLTQFVTSQGQDPREWVKKAGEVHFKTPINGDPDQGFVQTDFMFFPNVDWGTYYYGGGTDSAYKGVMRNVLVSSVAKSLGLKVGANGMFSRATNQLVNHGLDPDYVASVLLGKGHDRKSLKNVETIYNALSADPQRDAKLADFREYLQREGASEPEVVKENDVNFLARLRDRIVNQGMQAIVEAPVSADPYRLYEAEAAGVGGRAKGIEHLEDLVFRKGSQGVREALAIIDAAAANPGGTTTVKWDGKPAIIFGRKPSTGEFVLTDGSGFEAKGYDGLATSVDQLAQFMNMRSGDRRELIQLYATLWPMLEAATPANFRGYAKGDLLYMDTPPEVSGNYVFQPNTVEYRIPAQSSLGQRIGASTVGIAMHSMYADQGDARQPLSGVKFADVPGLLLIEPIYGNEITPNKPLIKEIKSLLSAQGAAIDTLFNPAELRSQQITDLAKLCVDYINYRIGTGHFENLLGEFGKWLQSKVSPRKFANIIEYLKSPSSNTEGMAAAFTLFLLLHDLKMDVLQQLDRQSPGNEGWVMATPSGYAKAVNRFDFTARNRARNNPQQA